MSYFTSIYFIVILLSQVVSHFSFDCVTLSYEHWQYLSLTVSPRSPHQTHKLCHHDLLPLRVHIFAQGQNHPKDAYREKEDQKLCRQDGVCNTLQNASRFYVCFMHATSNYASHMTINACVPMYEPCTNIAVRGPPLEQVQDMNTMTASSRACSVFHYQLMRCLTVPATFSLIHRWPDGIFKSSTNTSSMG